MHLVKDRVMRAWRELKTDAAQRVAEIERRQKAIREKLDRLDQAFLFERTIDIDTYDRHRDSCARSSRSRRWSGTLPSSRKWTRKVSWRSQNAFYRARRTSGSSRRSLRRSACSRCFFRRGFASTGKGLLEPA